MAINTTINIFILFIYSSCNQQKSNMAVAHLGDARDLAVGQLRQDPALLRWTYGDGGCQRLVSDDF